jgi:hypothetical protein
MLSRGLLMALGFFFFALAGSSSADAQANLDHGKTGAQLYASACATCHKSPQSVSNTKWFFGLESFLREHYTSGRESAAILAAYLKGQAKLSTNPQRDGGASRSSQVKPSEPTPNAFAADIPRPPADIPDVTRRLTDQTR